MALRRWNKTRNEYLKESEKTVSSKDVINNQITLLNEVKAYNTKKLQTEKKILKAIEEGLATYDIK
jgi:hypothetical protein